MSESGTRRQRRTQAQRRAETRAAVLAAARGVFARRGLHAASLEEIAEQAGVSRGAVYYHFTDKEQLFLALIRGRCRELTEQLDRVSGDSDVDLRRIATAFMEDAARNAEWARLFYEFNALAAEHPQTRDQLTDEWSACQDAIARLITRILDAQEITPAMPIDHLAAGVSALANGLALERLADPTLPPQLLAQLTELIIAGLQSAHQAASR